MKNKKDVWFQGETLWFNNKPPINNEVNKNMDVYITDLSNICTGLELCHIILEGDGGVFIWVAINTGFKVTRHLVGHSDYKNLDAGCEVRMWDDLHTQIKDSNLFADENAPLITNEIYKLMIELGCINPIMLD